MPRRTGSTMSAVDGAYMSWLEKAHEELKVAYTLWMADYFLKLRKDTSLLRNEVFVDGADQALQRMGQVLDSMEALSPGKRTERLHAMVVEAITEYREGVYLMRKHVLTEDYDLALKADDQLMKAGPLMQKWYLRLERMKAR